MKRVATNLNQEVDDLTKDQIIKLLQEKNKDLIDLISDVHNLLEDGQPIMPNSILKNALRYAINNYQSKREEEILKLVGDGGATWSFEKPEGISTIKQPKNHAQGYSNPLTNF